MRNKRSKVEAKRRHQVAKEFSLGEPFSLSLSLSHEPSLSLTRSPLEPFFSLHPFLLSLRLGSFPSFPPLLFSCPASLPPFLFPFYFSSHPILFFPCRCDAYLGTTAASRRPRFSPLSFPLSLSSLSSLSPCDSMGVPFSPVFSFSAGPVPFAASLFFALRRSCRFFVFRAAPLLPLLCFLRRAAPVVPCSFLLFRALGARFFSIFFLIASSLRLRCSFAPLGLFSTCLLPP